MARKKHLINVHSGTGTTAPANADLFLGEIAVQHTLTDPALWIKVGTSEDSNQYEKFIGETEILDLFDDIDVILGEDYTYSGLPYVNSASTLAEAYSALTNETLNLSAETKSILDRVASEAADITALSSATHSHVTDTNAHVTSTEKSTWNGKQDAISDLETIRSNAEAGAAKVSNVQADWNTTATTDESYIKNKPTIPTVPTSNTAFTNDAGYITGYTETDPTVPAWAKAASKPSYTANEVGALPTGTTLDDVADGTTRKLSDYATTANLNNLSGGTTAHTSNSAIHVPTGGTNGQVLMIQDGVPAWVTPSTITYSSAEPTGGNDGDIWVQTS